MLIGWLVACLLVEGRPLEPPEEASEWLERGRIPLAPRARNARELRLLPGVGELRALATVRAREAWLDAEARGEALPELAWEDVPGIGERTAERIRERLALEGAGTLGPLSDARPHPCAEP